MIHISKPAIRKKLPKRFEWGLDLMCRATMRTIQEKNLSRTCYFLSRLIEYEIKDRGFFCKIERIWKEIPGNIYFITEYETSNHREKIEEFEKEFFEKYGIKIKFVNLPNKASSFFIPIPP